VATECADCHVLLVSYLPPLPNENDEDDQASVEWVQIARLTAREYAEMLVESLHAKDIPAVILSGSGHFGFIGAMGATAVYPAGGGFSIAVPKENVAEADAEGAALFGDDWEKAKLYDIES